MWGGEAMDERESSGREHSDEGSGQVGAQTHSPTQLFFLQRLERQLRLSEEYATLLKPDAWETTLLQKAIYSTYCDCLQLGVAPEARDLLARRRARLG